MYSVPFSTVHHTYEWGYFQIVYICSQFLIVRCVCLGNYLTHIFEAPYIEKSLTMYACLDPMCFQTGKPPFPADTKLIIGGDALVNTLPDAIWRWSDTDKLVATSSTPTTPGTDKVIATSSTATNNNSYTVTSFGSSTERKKALEGVYEGWIGTLVRLASKLCGSVVSSSGCPAGDTFSRNCLFDNNDDETICLWLYALF